MALLHQVLLSHLPIKHRVSPRGWLTFDAPCCHHRGHKPDRRGRGNLMLSPDGKVGYNCYNCGLKTKFDGYELSKIFESLLHWLGVSSEEILQVKLGLLSQQLEGGGPDSTDKDVTWQPRFKPVDLPMHSVPLEQVATWEDLPDECLQVVGYLSTRGQAIAGGYSYYWSSTHKHDMNMRLIIPFYHQDQIVGWTARYAGTPPKGTPKYFNSELQPGYLFNDAALHKQGRRFVLLAEGAFDAIAIDGVAALGSELSQEQVAQLQTCGKKIVVAPDRQRRNQGLIDAALRYGWCVSFPEWEDEIKDAAQASEKYGRLYTVRTILENCTDSQLQISVKRQLFKDR